ncbi:Histone deacetylase hda1 [Apophysomyces ossiformis]|uniref:histone deacetylase n=1 Tax=Apophysomyces ossiformis TaxID=679940 RepID=A0A8H7BUD7_9FUNG|nr:Histone deacetylase hda1 [Apophysomyces ossiformis]
MSHVRESTGRDTDHCGRRRRSDMPQPRVVPAEPEPSTLEQRSETLTRINTHDVVEMTTASQSSSSHKRLTSDNIYIPERKKVAKQQQQPSANAKPSLSNLLERRDIVDLTLSSDEDDYHDQGDEHADQDIFANDKVDKTIKIERDIVGHENGYLSDKEFPTRETASICDEDIEDAMIDSDIDEDNHEYYPMDEVDELTPSDLETEDVVDIRLLLPHTPKSVKPVDTNGTFTGISEKAKEKVNNGSAEGASNAGNSNDKTASGPGRPEQENDLFLSAERDDNPNVPLLTDASDQEKDTMPKVGSETVGDNTLTFSENCMDIDDDGSLSSAPQSLLDDMDVSIPEPETANHPESATAVQPSVNDAVVNQEKNVGSSKKPEKDDPISSDTPAHGSNGVTYTAAKSRRNALRFLKTGYVYDVIMSFHSNLNDEYEKHPEDPRRIYCIYREFEKHGLTAECQRLPILKAERRHILRVHDVEHLKNIKATKDMTRQQLLSTEEKYESIYLNSHSYESSLYSAGGVIEACKAVVQEKVKNAFAIVRPPGHHAYSDAAMGFCLLNNVAIATRYCMIEEKVNRVLIVDW